MLQSLKTRELVSKSRTESYSTYNMKPLELLMYSLEGVLIIAVFGYFFYRSVAITLIAMPLVYFFIKKKKNELCEERKWNLTLQFKETLNVVNASLQAGYSMENAFVAAHSEMTAFYSANSDIVKELEIIKNGLNNGKQITSLLFDFSKKCQISDIRDFAEVYLIGKKTGGNICEITSTFINVIEDKVSIRQEIDTMISAKKYEQKVMNVIPFFIIFYVEITSKGFFDCLYHNVPGIIVMTFALCIYILSVYLANKIIDISI